jgi:hypothetical protein
MGAIVGCDGNVRDKYLESEYKVESDMREWEMSLKTFDKPFLPIISRFSQKCYNEYIKIPRSSAINFFKKEYTLKNKVFEDILDQEMYKTFDEKVRHLDTDKIKCLIFILSMSRPIDEIGKTQDKAKFLYFLFNDEANEAPVERDNVNIKLFFNNILMVICSEISKLQ